MTFSEISESPLPGTSASKPFVASYDLGYEFSQEHYIALQCMVEDETAEVATLSHDLCEVAKVA